MSVAVLSPSNAAGSRLEPLRVMVVDDSAVIRGLISRWIDAEPDLTVAASVRTGLDAVNQVQRVDPDVVVLDIEMPGESGLQVLQRIKSSRSDICVAMFTQHANSQHRARSLDGGADFFFDKSSDIDRLETLVRQLAAQPH